MNYRELINKELHRVGEPHKVVPLPPSKLPTARSITTLDRAILAQIQAYNAMRLKKA